MGKVILIIEDEPKNMKLFRDILQVHGYTTIEATDGQQGIESTRANKPDLILMDILLPVMNGLEATKILKADPETRDIPIIALTSYAMSGDRENTLEAGCDAYMTKPIEIKEFLKMVTEYLSG